MPAKPKVSRPAKPKPATEGDPLLLRQRAVSALEHWIKHCSNPELTQFVDVAIKQAETRGIGIGQNYREEVYGL